MFITLFIYLIWIIGLLGLFRFIYRMFDLARLRTARIPVRSQDEGRIRR